MKRFAEPLLLTWKNRKNRKPLIIRGARQTGKTYLVEQFARRHFHNHLKIDFEFDVELKALFKKPDPEKIIEELSLYANADIIAGRTLLFLDEIQACPEAIFALRYFYEKTPQLHVIAAGSLLEFTLREFNYAMPVGRVEFLYLNPMTFEEFLLAYQPRLRTYIRNLSLGDEMNPAIHQKLAETLRVYYFVGGMPEAVAAYIQNRHLVDVQRIQSGIVTTMQHDFAKYGTRTQQDHLRKAMQFVPRNIGRKIKYVQVDRELRSGLLKTAFDHLSLAKVIHLVHRSSGNGIPLDAEMSVTAYKAIFLDIGLVNRICGLKLVKPDQLVTVNEGRLAEQFVGQELLHHGPDVEENRLFYWNRERKNASAEIDYLITHQNQIIPVEVKAGKTGSLKSLHLMLHEKRLRLGVRFNMGLPSLGHFDTRVRYDKEIHHLNYALLSLPLYLAGQTERLLSEAEGMLKIS